LRPVLIQPAGSILQKILVTQEGCADFFVVAVKQGITMSTGSMTLKKNGKRINRNIAGGAKKKGETWISFAVNIKKLLRLLLIAYKEFLCLIGIGMQYQY
jgi:hypothetical protein